MKSVNTVETPITVLDLFSGCGGLSEGFHQFRPGGTTTPVFRSLGAVEWEPSAAASYAMNFGAESNRTQYFDPPEIFCRDIVGWEPKWAPGEIDVVMGGPPCQGFSALNRNKVRVERNKLWQEFIRVVSVLQPKVFVIENVDRFVRSVEFDDLQERIGTGNLMNYRLVEAPGATSVDTEQERARRYLLNAADYGALQARRRAIVIGIRTDVELSGNRMKYPIPSHARKARSTKAEHDRHEDLSRPLPWLTVDDLFEETSNMQLEKTDFPEGRTTTVRGISGKFAGPFVTTELHIARRPEAISLARYQAIPTNGNRNNLRGRYLCNFDDGTEVVIEKVEKPRNTHGELEPIGTYGLVVDGKTTSNSFYVLSHESVNDTNAVSPGRRKKEAFRVKIRDENTTRCATIEYLSTRSWDNHDSGAGDVMGRVRAGAPSVTVRTEFFKPEKGRYLHPTIDRPITHYEAAKLQGFPDNFRWCGSKTDIAKQIGNAVPVPLGLKIAESIHAYLRPSTV